MVGIYLYTHRKGQDWPERLRQALITGPARLRWEDPQYLARILIDQLFSDLRDKAWPRPLGQSRRRAAPRPVDSLSGIRRIRHTGRAEYPAL